MNPLADTIIAKLRQCTTAGEIERLASGNRSEVMAMKETDPARFWHVVNAKAYYLKWMK